MPTSFFELTNSDISSVRSNLKVIAIKSVLSAHISLYSCGYGFCDSLERIIVFGVHGCRHIF